MEEIKEEEFEEILIWYCPYCGKMNRVYPTVKTGNTLLCDCGKKTKVIK